MWWRENFNDEDDDRVSEQEHKLISTQTTSVDFLLSNKFPRFVPFFISAITVLVIRRTKILAFLNHNKIEDPRLLCFSFLPWITLYSL